MQGRLKLSLCVFFITLFLAGCSNFSLTLSFSEIQGLKKGAGVFFDGNQVGQVTHISYTDEGVYLVSVAVDKDFRSAFTEYSRFDIAASPLKENEKAVIMTLVRKGGRKLEKNTTIKALPASPLQGLTPFIDRFKSGMDDLMEDMNSLPENEKYQEFEKKLDELADQMKESGKAFQEKMQNEIIPKLKKTLEDLGRQLNEKEKREKTLPLEKKLQQLEDV